MSTTDTDVKGRQLLLLSIISNHYTIKERLDLFQFVSLFSQVGVEKLRNPLSNIIRFHRLYILRNRDKQIVEVYLEIFRRLNLTKTNRCIEDCL